MAAALNLLPGCKSLHYGRNDQRSSNFHGFTFQRLGTQADARKHCSVEPLKWATRVVFRHLLPISGSRACQSRGSLRNSPDRIFQRLGKQTDVRRILKTFEREFDSLPWAAE